MEFLAETRQAVKRFGRFTAVSGVDLAVRPGEVLGLLGANGVGKTTMIRLLLGLLVPSDGVIRLFGEAPSIPTRRRVGYVPQALGLYAGLTVAENWDFTASAFRRRGVPMPEGISAWRRELVSSLPLGAQRQVAFAVALSHRPELLVLDEPTSGVGPLVSARLWEEIRQAAATRTGVLVTTHNMEEAEQCDRLMIMANGREVAAGTATDITARRQVTEVRAPATGTGPSACSTPAGCPCNWTVRCYASGRRHQRLRHCCPARAWRRTSSPSRRLLRRHSWHSSHGRRPREPYRPAARDDRAVSALSCPATQGPGPARRTRSGLSVVEGRAPSRVPMQG
jgi:ABC-2 type transport system ATP-binding protein